MTRNLIITLSLISSLAASAADTLTQKMDTLLYTPNASAININANRSNTSITVTNIGGSGDNFFYETGTSTRIRIDEQSRAHYSDITNLLIAESDTKKLIVKFTSDRNDDIAYTYNIPDPDNRYVKTFLGAKSSDFGITIKHTGKTKWELVSGGLGFGWVSPLDSKPSMDVSMWKSNELTWAIILGVKMSHGPHALTTGLGIDWRNYVTKGDRYFHKDDDGKISLMPYEENMTKHRSRIKTFSLQIPVLYGFSFGHRRNFGLEVGPVLNFNTGGSIKTQYTIGSHDYSIKTHKIHQKPVTVDVLGMVRYQSLGLYVRYAPMEVLRTSTGLDFKSISTGIMLMF